MDYDVFFNSQTKANKPSVGLEAALAIRRSHAVVDLVVGSPNLDVSCPLVDMTVTLRDGQKLHLSERELQKWLKYSSAYGFVELKQQVFDLIRHVHNPPTAQIPPEDGGLSVAINSGSSESLRAVFHTLLEAGDTVLIQDPVFTEPLQNFREMRVNVLPVIKDEKGLRPDNLEYVLETWNKANPTSATATRPTKPKLLYIITTNCNPTGVTTTPERVLQIYQLAQKYNLLILEDDPYYFLSYKKEFSKSFLSVDTDGRVIRCDSFSKIIAPGLRLGVVLAAQPLLYRIILRNSRECLHASGISQAIVSKYLEQVGTGGFLRHCLRISSHYKTLADATTKALNKYMKGKAEWNTPEGGFYIWVKLTTMKNAQHLKNQPADKKVLVWPGNSFFVHGEHTTPYFRISFGLCTVDEIEEGIRRLADIIANNEPHEMTNRL